MDNISIYIFLMKTALYHGKKVSFNGASTNGDLSGISALDAKMIILKMSKVFFNKNPMLFKIFQRVFIGRITIETPLSI